MKPVIHRFYVLLLIVLSAVLPAAEAQTVQPPEDLQNPYEIVQKYLKQNNYITPLFELKQMEDKYLASPMWKEPYLDVIIYLEVYVGNYDEASIVEN